MEYGKGRSRYATDQNRCSGRQKPVRSNNVTRRDPQGRGEGVSCPSAGPLSDLPGTSQRLLYHSRHRSKHPSDRQSSDHYGDKQAARRNSEAQILQGVNGAVGKRGFDRAQRRYGRSRREFGGGLELWKRRSSVLNRRTWITSEANRAECVERVDGNWAQHEADRK